ncbi:MAG: DUF805 domain-containing protein [Cypionkella sp.]
MRRYWRVCVQPLLWCFFSWRGRLNRQEFALAFFFIAAVAFVVGAVLSATMVGSADTSPPQSETDLLMAQLQTQTLASLVVLWPTLAIQVKRLRDIGYSWLYLVAANILVFVVLLIAPIPGIIIALAASLYLFFAKGKQA